MSFLSEGLSAQKRFKIALQFCKSQTAICPARPHLGWSWANGKPVHTYWLDIHFARLSHGTAGTCVPLQGRERIWRLWHDLCVEDMEGGGEILSDCCAGIFLEVLRKHTGIPVIFCAPAAMSADCLQSESAGRLWYVSLFAFRSVGQ